MFGAGGFGCWYGGFGGVVRTCVGVGAGVFGVLVRRCVSVGAAVCECWCVCVRGLVRWWVRCGGDVSEGRFVVVGGMGV